MLRKEFLVSRIEVIVKLTFSKFFIAILCILVSINYSLWFYSFDRWLYIYVLNVGQGDSILIRTPDKKYMLIDTGPDKKVVTEVGKYLPFWQKKLDYVLITHPDADHLGGMQEIMDKYDIVNIIYSGLNTDTAVYKAFSDRLNEQKKSFVDLKAGSDILIGCCVSADFVWGELSKLEGETETNNFSTSFILGFGNFRAFFGGDLASKYEDMIAKYNPYDLDMLKVGHHGSKYSTSDEFLNRTTPELAVIQVGAKNTYGHPHPETVERLSKHGVKTYIDYKYETLYFKTDGIRLYEFAKE